MGAAWAWTLRVTVDAILLFAVAGQIPGWRRVLPGGALVLIAAMFSPRSAASLNTAIELVVLALAFAWSWSVSPHLRTMVQTRFTGRRVSEVA